jgi:predicted RecA/RadA family phage recombinase
MKTFKGNGDSVTVTNGSSPITSGSVVVTNDLIGVALAAADSGAAVQVALNGIFSVTKPTGAAFAVGQPAYWNAASGAEFFATTTRTYIGICVSAAASGAGNTTVDILFGYAPRRAFTA